MFFNAKDNSGGWPYYLINYISGSSEISYGEEGINRNISIVCAVDKCQVAMPNDILGAQAFYVILENIIRNSVKHSIIPTVNTAANDGTTRKLLELTIKEDTTTFEDNDYHKIIIKDNLGECNKGNRAKRTYESEENKQLSFVEWMNSTIDRTILDDYGVLRQNDWGLLEIKICAAYLRKYPLESLDKDCKLRLVNIELDENNNLIHELYLLKPKIACIITEDEVPEVCKKQMEKMGVHLVTVKEIGDNLKHLLKYGVLKDSDGKPHEVSHTYLIFEHGILNGENEVTSNQPFINLTLLQIIDLCRSDNIELDILQKLSGGDSQEIFVVKFTENEITETVLAFYKNKIVFQLHDYHRALSKSTSYYERYGTQSGTAKIIVDIDATPEKNKHLVYELSLAAKLKIGILDERIQAEICKPNASEVEELERMNIIIPEATDINLNKNNFNESEDSSVKKKVNRWIKENKKKLDYIVIHQGVIEKTVGSTDVKVIKEFVDEYNNNAKATLIIISGRGKPSNLPQDIFYLPFSLVNQYVIPYRSKVYLYKLLQSARRYK